MSYKNDSDRDCMFQDMQIALQNQLVAILEEFREKYSNTIMITEFYTIYYTMQLKIRELVSSLEDKIKSFHTNDLFEN